MKKSLVVIFLILTFSFTVFSQRGANVVNVNISTNPSGATFIFGSDTRNVKGPTPMNMQLNKGQLYEITFSKAGYHSKTITYKAGTGNINETLQPIQYTLSVSSNVSGASVFVNNSFSGQTPVNLTLNAGNYNISIKANGYKDYNTSVNLTSNNSVNANLVLNTFVLSVSSNPAGAQVFVNNNLSGNSPLNLTLTPGNYNISVKAPNYKDYNTTVNLSSNSNINATLEPDLFAKFILPHDARVWIDGVEQQIKFRGERRRDRRGKDNTQEFTLYPTKGKRRCIIRIEYNDLEIEQPVDFDNTTKTLGLILK